jgi:6-pyruvoyltetrahydropterin 2'-reductase
MIKQIIPANAYKTRKVFEKDGDNFLRVSEFYYDTIQGEGIYIGHPAAFLRLQGCSLNCFYCDSKEVWRFGSPYTFKELLALIPPILIIKLHCGQHLVLTGGSPLLQMERLYYFILAFYEVFHFKPFVEIENECTIMPYPYQTEYINCWNNSPKLASSGVPFEDRYKPDVIKYLSGLNNSWFKFVISSEDDWEEIEVGFLMPDLIQRNQIILMPEGATKEEIERRRPIVIQMAVENGVGYCTREHIINWGKCVGV